jgi:hypothetical protein
MGDDPHLHHAAAFGAIAASLPLGSTAFEPELGPKEERFIWLEPRFVDRLAALRGPGESYSEVILRIGANQRTSDMSKVPKTPNLEQPGWRSK